MNFKDLSQHLVTDTCPVGEGFEVTVDANKYRGECYRRMAEVYRECEGTAQRAAEMRAGGDEESYATYLSRMAESVTMTAEAADLHRRVYSDVLAVDRYGIIQGWVLDDGAPPTYENLVQLAPDVLRAIFEWGREVGLPKEQGTPTKTPLSLTTQETTSDGSSVPTTPSPESPSTPTTL